MFFFFFVFFFLTTLFFLPTARDREGDRIALIITNVLQLEFSSQSGEAHSPAQGAVSDVLLIFHDL